MSITSFFLFSVTVQNCASQFYYIIIQVSVSQYHASAKLGCSILFLFSTCLYFTITLGNMAKPNRSLPYHYCTCENSSVQYLCFSKRHNSSPLLADSVQNLTVPFLFITILIFTPPLHNTS